MPSTIVGFFSGGIQLVSGNPYSGNIRPFAGVRLRVSNLSGPQFSGAIYVGLSGGITMMSGGGQSSGGLNDGWELRPGDTKEMVMGPGGIAEIWVTTPAASSGGRLFWEAY